MPMNRREFLAGSVAGAAVLKQTKVLADSLQDIQVDINAAELSNSQRR